MSDYVKVASVNELPDPGKQLVEVDDRLLVLFHVSGEYFCLEDVCTHDGGPLGEGELTEYTIACPRHGAAFDIRSGKALIMPATEDTFAHAVKVEADGIYVKVNDQDDDAGSPGVTSDVSSSAVDAPDSTRPSNSQTEPAPAPERGSSGTDEAPASELSEDGVREELKKVIDPELFVNIVDLGLIYDIDLQRGEDDKLQVMIDMTMTSPACPAGPQLIANCRQVVGQMNGVDGVEVKIVMEPPWTPDKMTDDAKDQLGIF